MDVSVFYFPRLGEIERHFPSPLALFMHAKNHRREGLKLSTPNIRPGPYARQRRSQRILLSVPILVSGVRANGAIFSERTHTMVVSAHGAMVQLREQVLPGHALSIKNLATNEELNCTVVDINRGSSTVFEVGVEFTEPCPRFLRASFPPSDWNPRSPEAKRVSSFTAPVNPVVV